jgi:hypothetical protein
MQQRQLRLGDILDDYCPRERRLTNHAVVAMIGAEVKQTRCTTCDAEHEYKHAKVPRQRRKSETPAALYAQVAAGKPKRIPHEHDNPELLQPSEPFENAETDQVTSEVAVAAEPVAPVPPSTVAAAAPPVSAQDDPGDEIEETDETDAAADPGEDGPVHRPLIRATLPRQEGQPPPQRQSPDFTIRQPGGRGNRFRPRHQRGGQQFFGNRQNGNAGGSMRGGPPRQGGGRPPHGSMGNRSGRRQGPGRKRSK